MEIARLEVSTQQHLERMQETAKWTMSSMGSQLNPRKRSHNLVQGQAAKGQADTKGQVATGDPDLVENPTKDLLYCLTPATDGERKTPKGTGLQGCGHHLQRVWKERTLWESLLTGKALCTLSGDTTDQFSRGWGQWTPIFQWWGTASLHLHGQCPPC